MASTALEQQPSLEERKRHDPVDHVNEKHLGSEEGSVEQEESFEGYDTSHPFPIDPEDIEETHQLTVRAVFVGCCLGAVVGASNIYLGLKTGFTFGPQLFGAIFGFAILKPFSKVVPEGGLIGRLFGGYFGPKENCTVQTAATAAGGLGILFVSAVPAMYRLELMSENPADDIGKLIALTACAGFFGLFFVIPLRRYYIIQQKLTFPTPAATAFTIRQLHKGKTGAVVAYKKAMGLVYSFAATFVFKIMTGYAPGIIYDWHIGWTLYRLGFTGAIQIENFGWILEFTPAFFGVGMLSGINASYSFLGGMILAWGVIGPSLIKNGLAVGRPNPDDPNLVSHLTMVFTDTDAYVDAPSVRYWLLWPGVLIMLVYSFADIFIGMLPFILALRSDHFKKINPVGWFRRSETLDEEDEDQTPLADRVPILWWTLGLAASGIMSIAILSTLFHMNVGTALLSLILGFVFSFIAVQSSGHTDVNPVSTVAKASQLIFGGISNGAGMAEKPAQTVNLVAGVIAAGSAAQSTDMCGDLKTGYLLRAKPKNQFIAQLAGSVVAVFLTCGLYLLFVKASPCIIRPDPDKPCTYSAPSVAAWAAVALAVTKPRLPVPPSSGYTAIGLSIASVLTVLAKYYLVPKKYHGYVPNWNAIGLAFVVPNTYYPIAMFFGSTFNYFWLKRSPKTFDLYMFPVSAGLLAGEGLGGVLQAVLAIAGVDGGVYGTAIGCPLNEYCG